MAVQKSLVVLATLLLATFTVQASDPELTSDFAVPPGVNASSLDGNFFTFTGFRNVSAGTGNFATVAIANLATGYAALEGLGVSTALFVFQANSMIPLHTHPRGSEVLYIIEGTLDVGLIDSTNKLYTQTLQTGDLFVFPKGLVHYEINYAKDPKFPVVKALAAFSSSNAGLIVLPTDLFGSFISDSILAQSFGVSTDVIHSLKEAQGES